MQTSNQQLSFVARLKRAVRRMRRLLAAPELLLKLDIEISEIKDRLDQNSAQIDGRLAAAAAHWTTIAQRFEALSAELKSEISGQLGFSFYDQTERVTALDDSIKSALSGLRELLVQQESNLSSRLEPGLFLAEITRATSRQKSESNVLESRILEQLQQYDVRLKELVNLGETLKAVEAYQLATSNAVGELNGSLSSRMNSLETFQSESRNVMTELNTSLNSRMNGLETAQSESKNILDELKNLVAHIGTSLETQRTETKNLFQHVNSSIGTRLNSFENKQLPAISDQIHELIAVQFELTGRIGKSKPEQIARPAERFKPAKRQQWTADLAKAEHEFRIAYPFWKERLDAMLEAFRQTKVGNAAWGGDVYSRVFRGFVERYASGRVLDVGCGIFGRPYYLSDYRAKLVSGLDPLEPEEAPDFEFVRGISEYLPWPDGAFSTVISATSLDHCLSLDRSLAEIRRVLRAKGRFLLWIGSTPGAPRYEPEKPDFSPADKFHLFHFDVDWFEPLLSRSFNVVDRLVLDKASYSHVMYCLERESDVHR